MGNLGAYQDIVTNAKAAGGVEKLIESIEKSAAAKAMPKAFAAGAAVTAAAAVGVTAIVKQVSKRIEARKAEANQAKARLASIVDEASAGQDAVPDDKRDDEDEGPDPAGSEGQP